MTISTHFDTLPKLTDDEAIALIVAIKRAHNFVGTVFTPNDVRDAITTALDQPEPTDAQVQAVFDSWEWRKGLADALCERGWEVLDDAIFALEDAEYNNEVANEAAAQDD